MPAAFVPGFLPSTAGLRFENRFPDDSPVVKIHVPIVGQLEFGDASGGLCGGMVFAVRDFFEAGIAAPATLDSPANGTPLYDFLCRRLLDSFDLPHGVIKYYRWMSLPAHDGIITDGIWRRTLEKEWPQIQREIDDRRLAPLGLVTVQSHNPMELGQCHQVLAFGYDLADDTGMLKLWVYDPNYPLRDDLVMSLATDPDEPAEIYYSTGLPVRGFFLTPYEPANVVGLT